MYNDLSDLGSLIQVQKTPEVRILNTQCIKQTLRRKNEIDTPFSEPLVFFMTMPFDIPI